MDRSVEPSDADELLELGDAFFELNREWRIVRVNANQEKLSRKPRSETLGRVFWELWPETANPDSLYWREYHRCMEQRVPVQFEDHYAPLDLWTGVTAYPTRIGIAVFFRDVTDRKRAEEALRVAEERFRVAVKNAAFVPAQTDRDLRYQWIYNPHPDFDAAHVLGKRDDELDDSEGARRLVRLKQRVLDSGEGSREEISFTRRDGVRYYDFVVEPARDAAGAVIGVMSAAFDVTERKRAELALREGEERFRSVLENMSEGLMLFDANGDTLYQNPAALRIHGVETDAGGRFQHDELPVTWRGWDEQGRPLPFDEWPISRVLRNERFQDQVLHAERVETGHAFDASYNGCPIHDAEGKLVRGFITIRDITEQVRAKAEQDRAEVALRGAIEQLREADRRKDEFLGMLSHELRNPLAPIRNSLYLLDHAEPAGERARRAKDTLNRQVAHLNRLVDDLLDVTRVARGKMELRRTTFDLGSVVQRTAEDHRTLIQDRGIEFTVEAPAVPVPIHADETRIAQVIGNLLHNAAKFTPGGGSVAVSLVVSGGAAELRVRDTGSGIDPRFSEQMFEPFTQGQQTLARTEGGLGLGLALVKGLVELHGGTATVSSQGVGHGSEFTIRLPLAARAHAASQSTAGATATARRRYRVLVVDDNKDAAESLAELVHLFGHDVEVAYDGPSAIERARVSLPDVVLCDIGLPGVTGYEVAEALRSGGTDRMRLIAVSGYAQPEDVKRAREAGFDAHIAKPPDPAHIERLLA